MRLRVRCFTDFNFRIWVLTKRRILLESTPALRIRGLKVSKHLHKISKNWLDVERKLCGDWNRYGGKFGFGVSLHLAKTLQMLFPRR